MNNPRDKLILDIKDKLIIVDKLSQKFTKNGYRLSRESKTGRFVWHKKNNIPHWATGALL
jgi:hypothetical protein